ncbi:MAG: SEL1-like repeat protein [Puniceicoccales bacterium]|jgi:TPR repeat protein|nr:SEL1-like repeat protein [Puniceicoccales bacterium]
MYFNGEFVSKNLEEAFKWFAEAAKQGYGPAQSMISFSETLWNFLNLLN